MAAARRLRPGRLLPRLALPALALVALWAGGLAALLLEAALLLMLATLVVLAPRTPLAARLREHVFPPLARKVLRLELELLATAPRWVLRSRRAPPPDEFSYHRGAPDLAVALALAPVLAVEAAVIHLLLPQRSFWPRVAVLALSAYGLALLLLQALALRVYPHRLGDHAVELRLGQLYRARVPYSSIRSVGERSERVFAGMTGTGLSRRDGVAYLAVGGRTSVLVELVRPVELEGPLRTLEATHAIAVAADEADRFRTRLEERRTGERTG